MLGHFWAYIHQTITAELKNKKDDIDIEKPAIGEEIIILA